MKYLIFYINPKIIFNIYFGLKHIKQKYVLIFFFIIFSQNFTYSQNIKVEGRIIDLTTKVPLESANVIAKPTDNNKKMKYAISDSKGEFSIELDNQTYYIITISYLGYKDETIDTKSIEKPYSEITVNMIPTGEILKEIIIKNETLPIEIKVDTISYDVKSFSNGNERKLKEVLEKLPGVEVDKNGIVTVQGKKVTQMLVEGKSFFGGGSKLAVENIPADALEKIEVIDNFNETGFLKQVSDSDQLAMNVKLKKEKKKFIFGDAEGGIGNKPFYSLHSSLFYYSPLINSSIIFDKNTLGKSTFTFDDFLRFEGGISNFITGRKPLSNIYRFTSDNKDVITYDSDFSALNFSADVSKKVRITCYGLFSNTTTNGKNITSINYLKNEVTTTEKRILENQNLLNFNILNLKLEYSPDEKEKLYYNGQMNINKNNLNSHLNSETDYNTSSFNTINHSNEIGLKQYIEWHKNYSSKYTSTVVLNNTINNLKPNNNWINSDKFFNSILPLYDDTKYHIQQEKKVKSFTVDLLYKHYYVVNRDNHIYFSIGNNYENFNFKSSEEQILNDNSINNFNSSGFGNNLNYYFNNLYTGIEYKFKFNKLIFKPGFFIHNYELTYNSTEHRNKQNKILYEPQFSVDYEINNSEKFSFNYRMSNEFPESLQLIENYTLQSYNIVYKGNFYLKNENYNFINLKYTKFSTIHRINFYAFLNYINKNKTIRNEVIFDGINQFTTPLQTNNPENTLNIHGSFIKKLYKFTLKSGLNFNYFNFYQRLNDFFNNNQQINTEINFGVKTSSKKWPVINIEYTRGWNDFRGINNKKFQSNTLMTFFEITILKNLILNTDYSFTKNTNSEGEKKSFNSLNFALRFQEKKNPFKIELNIQNLTNIKFKNDFSFSDYSVSQRKIYIMPRSIILTIICKI